MPEADAPAGGSYALIVANDHYQDPGLSRLRSPAQDARRLAETLQDPSIGGFLVRSLINRPTPEILEEIEGFFADRKFNDLLVLYFSCHGVKDPAGRLYLATPTTKRNRLAATGISADFVNELMDRSRSRKIALFLDCCYSGAFPRGLTSRSTAHVGVDRFEGRGRTVITASSALEYAYESGSDTFTGSPVPSIFTSALVEALKSGAADTDQDGFISVDELYDYVFDRVREANPNQTPEKVSNVRGELIIARNPQPPPIRPEPLPAEILQGLESNLPHIRAGAVHELARLLKSDKEGLVIAARRKLEILCDDDSRLVSASADAALGGISRPLPQPQPKRPPARTPVSGQHQETVQQQRGSPAQQPLQPKPAWPPPRTRPMQDRHRSQQDQPGWAIRHSLWILPAVIGLGLATWISFLYIGIQAHRRSWIIAGAGYAVAAIVVFSLFGIDTAQTGDPNTTGPIGTAGGVILMATWLGGIIHAAFCIPKRLHMLRAAAPRDITGSPA